MSVIAEAPTGRVFWAIGALVSPLSTSKVAMQRQSLPVIICVPVRDEAAALPSFLDAMFALRSDGTSLTVCIHLDGCRDDSEAMLRRAAAKLPMRLVIGVESERREANAGAARRAALALGLTCLGVRDGLLCTTDADSHPRSDWIDAGIAALGVADFAAGRIVRQGGASDDGQTRIEAYYDRLYRYRRSVDPVPWEADDVHHFTGGANLAMRAGAYQAIGGFRPLPCGEDATLLDDAARAGFRVRRDSAMIVETSSRRDGRAMHGLASALTSLDAGAPQIVAHPGAAIWQWREHAQCRRAFAIIHDPAVRAGLGERLGLTADHVLGVARDCPNAEAFAMRIVPSPPIEAPRVPLLAAEAFLAAAENTACEVAA